MDDSVAAKIDAFFQAHSTHTYAKCQVLILAGEESKYIYQLVEGRVREYDITARGDEIVLNVFKPEAFFPMSLAINGGTSQYIYEAETDIKVRRVAAGSVVEFIKANPDVMYDLLSRLYRGIDGLLGRMVHRMADTANGRLAYEIVIEARRFGAEVADGSYLLDINEKVLAARAGLTRETVSREIHKLKEAGELEVQSKGILVKDIEAVERRVG